MQAIILTGLACSGKDAAADYIEKKYGFKKYVLSDVLAAELKRTEKPVNKINMALLGDELRKKEGMDAVAKRLAKKIHKKDKKIIIAGARSIEEFEFFKKSFRDAILVEIKADKERRFERRGTADPGDRREFFRRDEIDIREKGLGRLIAKADFSIENNKSLPEFFSEIDNLVKNTFK